MSFKGRFAAETLTIVLVNFHRDRIDKYDEIVCALTDIFSYSYSLIKLDLDIKKRDIPPAKPSTEEQPMLELKKMPGRLRYMLLGEKNTLPVIVAADLVETQRKTLV